MAKKTIGSKTFLYPMPTVIVGAEVKGKPNFLVIAYCGIVNHSPAMIAIASNKAHYTNEGIKEAGAFSVNIPSTAMVKITDYCGIASGRNTDKSKLFKTFFGRLKNAPMIEECPLNLECKLVKTVVVGDTHEIFIGEIVETYTDDKYLTNGLPDIKKIDPIVFSMHDNNYWKVGEHIAHAWQVGKDFNPRG